MKPKNATFLALFIITFFIGCIQSGTSNGTTPIELSMGPSKQDCPHQCCIDEQDYNDKVCFGEHHKCIKNSCVQKDCPHDCCDGSTYELKRCDQYHSCTGNTCTQKDCPYDCCDGSTFSMKTCKQYYSCSGNTCLPDDLDQDGLYDYEEYELGTSIVRADTDADGLDDYQEIKLKGTDPLNENTDGDRYDDGEDPNPVKINSADIEIAVIKNEGNWNEELKSKLTLVVLCSSLGFFEPTTTFAAACLSFIGLGEFIHVELSQRNIEVQTKNVGDDYTNWVNYEMSIIWEYESGTTELFDTINVKIGKLNPGETHIEKLNYTFTLIDYTLKNFNRLFEGKTGDKEYLFEFKNLQYEKF